MYAQPAHPQPGPGPQLCRLESTPCPLETEEVRRRYDWRAVLLMPWHAVETIYWQLAATEPRYLEEVPVVLKEVERAREGRMEVAR
ncbi:hypothetical protein GCM10027048_28120 [Hymenobacter coalescens]